jgi:hypothetical protein
MDNSNNNIYALSKDQEHIKIISNYDKGKYYENYINTYINTLETTKISYLWNNVPEQVLFNIGLITNYNKHRLIRKNKIVNLDDPINTLKDVGIDIIQINKNNNSIFVQCKDYSDTLKVNDLSGFWMIMAKHILKEGIVYHSTNKISVNIKENIDNRIKFIHKPIDGIIEENKDNIKFGEIVVKVNNENKLNTIK